MAGIFSVGLFLMFFNLGVFACSPLFVAAYDQRALSYIFCFNSAVILAGFSSYFLMKKRQVLVQMENRNIVQGRDQAIALRVKEATRKLYLSGLFTVVLIVLLVVFALTIRQEFFHFLLLLLLPLVLASVELIQVVSIPRLPVMTNQEHVEVEAVRKSLSQD